MLKKENGNELVGEYTHLVFACSVCKKVYKKPGMCHECDVVLKPKGG